MHFLVIFAAGMYVGSKLNRIRKTLAPYVGNVAEQFDAMYSQVAQKVGQKYEDFEDTVAEKRYHAGNNNSHSKRS